MNEVSKQSDIQNPYLNKEFWNKMQDKDRFVDDTLWVKQKKQQYKMSSDIYTST